MSSEDVDYPSVPTTSIDEIEENFLRSCRNGDLGTVKQFLAYRDAKKVDFNISCKGRSKYNGWSPIILATYFGHRHVVEHLLSRNADVNAVNENGDTALHKAAFIGREDLVMLLLQNDADVCIINGEGRLPRDMVQSSESGREIAKLLKAAEQTETLRKETKMLSAAREGNIIDLNSMLKDTQNPPNINCIDSQGNTCLHCAAYRGHKKTAVLLLQNGIDTNIRNNMGQTALNLTRDPQMIQILSVKSVRKVQKSVNRLEGPLLRRSRFLGWRPIWAVLERGVLNYYPSRADSTGINKNKRRDYKYLDSARISLMPTLASFVVHFSDGALHRLSVVSNDEMAQVERQKWVNALQEHAAYSSHYLWGGEQRRADSDDDNVTKAKPLGCMTDALDSASASFEVLQRQLGECTNNVEQLQRNMTATSKTCDNGGNLPASLTTLMHFQMISETAANMVSSLHHCLTLFHQQEDVRVLQLKEEKEKCRVLEESLNVLAKEHHQLEQSVASHLSEKGGNAMKNFLESNDDDEFHDAFHDAEDSDDEDTLMTASVFNSPTESLADLRSIPIAPYERFSYNSQRDSYHTAADDLEVVKAKSNGNSDEEDSDDTLVDGTSIASSCNTYISDGGDAYKCARDEFFFRSNNESELIDFSESIPCDQVCSISTPTPESKALQTVTKRYHRTSLPSPMFSRNDFSIWSVLKNCIGKELSKITMPVIFNEPLSFLQRMTEYMEYARLLRVAAEQEDPIERMKYIAGFAVSALASNWERLGKPFNPLLGETYEYQNADFRIICEQVSHHPPVSAFHADAPHFKFSGAIHPKLKFWGKSVEIQPKGVVTVELPKWNESYTWSNVNCCVHNIIVGKMWIEQYGTMEITNKTNGIKAVLSFKPANWASKDLHRVEGTIYDKNEKGVRFIYGKWTEFIKSTDYESYEEYLKENAHKFRRSERSKSPNESPAHTPRKVLSKLNSLKMSSFRSLSIQEPEETPEPSDGDLPKCDSTYSIDIPHSEMIWEAEPRPPNTAEFYQFTLFAMTLNEMPDIKPPNRLCSTDSRLRPDVRKLELGDIDGAALEKTRLEEKQRDSRKAMKSRKEEWKPKWFALKTNPNTNLTDWIYNGEYWNRKYDEIDIF